MSDSHETSTCCQLCHHQLRPIMQRLCQMCGLNLITPCQVCYRTCQLHTSRVMTLCCAYARADKLSCVMHSTMSLPASAFDLHPAICKTAGSLPHDYRRCKQWSAKSPDFAFPKSRDFGLQIVRAVCFSRLALAHELIHWICQSDLHSTIHNPRVELRCEYRFYRAMDPKSTSDIL